MSIATRAGGRPRSAEAHAAILVATLEVLAESGFGGLTIEEVATRAGVGRPTVYRRWSSKLDLVLETLASVVEQLAVPDTGDTRRDLVLLLENIVKTLTTTPTGSVSRWMVAEGPRIPELARVLNAIFVRGRRRSVFEVLRRGVRRGDLRPDLDENMAADLLVAPIYYRFLVSKAPINRRLIEAAADGVMTLFGPPSRSSGRRQTRSGTGSIGRKARSW